MLIILFGVMLAVSFSGSVIWTSLGFASVVGIVLFLGPIHFRHYGMIAYVQGTSMNQMIAPMFILMAEFLTRGGIAEDIYAVMSRAVGRLKGGLAMATILACTIFAALCGSAPATAASIGRISIKEMTDRGYSPAFATGTVAAGGTLGIMIPPSITLAFFGILTETSIVRLLMAGILPGVLFAVLMLVYIIISVRLKPEMLNYVEGSASDEMKDASDMDADTASGIMDSVMAAAKREVKDLPTANVAAVKKKVTFLTILPAVALIFIVLISMYAGLATPIEAAGYGVIGSFLICLIQRRLSGKMFMGAMHETARNGAMLIFLIMGGFMLTYVISFLGIAMNIAEAIVASGLNRYVILLALYVVWFILGMLMSPACVILLTIPFMFPSLVLLGFDPIWLGVVSVIASQLAMITPPVGLNLFVLKAITGIPISTIIKGAVPYVLVLLVGLLILTIFPSIATILPNLMF